MKATCITITWISCWNDRSEWGQQSTHTLLFSAVKRSLSQSVRTHPAYWPCAILLGLAVSLFSGSWNHITVYICRKSSEESWGGGTTHNLSGSFQLLFVIAARLFKHRVNSTSVKFDSPINERVWWWIISARKSWDMFILWIGIAFTKCIKYYKVWQKLIPMCIKYCKVSQSVGEI